MNMNVPAMLSRAFSGAFLVCGVKKPFFQTIAVRRLRHVDRLAL
jgi:hypothetical protein